MWNLKNRLKRLGVASMTIALIAAGALGTSPGGAAAADDRTELAEKTQIPVADLISVPFENSFNFNTGVTKSTGYDLNVQPIVPFHLDKDWNLITRTIVPVLRQPSFPVAPGDSQTSSGLGDINPSLFFSPADSGAGALDPRSRCQQQRIRIWGPGRSALGPMAAGLTIQAHGSWGCLSTTSGRLSAGEKRREPDVAGAVCELQL